MKLQFDANQQYQLDAVAAITDLFEGQPQGAPEYSVIQVGDWGGLFAGQAQTELGVGNHLLLAPEKLLANARALQTRNDIEIADTAAPLEAWDLFDTAANAARTCPHFSVEMETGTGKTYVYLRTIFELSRRYGLQKFIIVVPSVAIREGVLKNIEITAEHFRALYNNLPFEHFVYDAKKVNRLRQFAVSNTVQILVAALTLGPKKLDNDANRLATTQFREQDAVAKFAVILPAAGRSSRFGDKMYKKPFIPMANRPVWIYSAERFVNRKDVVQLILVIAPEDREEFFLKFASNVAILGIDVVEGGAERSDTVEKALARVKPEAEFVCIHDAARPCLVDPWVDNIFAAAERTGAAIFAVPVSGTLKRVGSDKSIEETVSRSGLWEAQTPQVFRRELILEAYAQRGGFHATDDAQLVERLGRKVTVVLGSALNVKITTREDLRLAEQALKALPKPKLSGMTNPFADDDMWR